MDTVAIAATSAGVFSIVLFFLRVFFLVYQGKDWRAECLCGKQRVGISYDADGDGKITTNQVYVINANSRSVTSRPVTPQPVADSSTASDTEPPPAPLKLKKLAAGGRQHELGEGVMDVDPTSVRSK